EPFPKKAQEGITVKLHPDKSRPFLRRKIGKLADSGPGSNCRLAAIVVAPLVPEIAVPEQLLDLVITQRSHASEPVVPLKSMTSFHATKRSIGNIIDDHTVVN